MRLNATLAVTGLALIAARIILPMILGLVVKVSLNQAAGICGSTIGVMAQAMSSQVANGCAQVSQAMTVLNLTAIGGAVLAVVFGLRYVAGKRSVKP